MKIKSQCYSFITSTSGQHSSKNETCHANVREENTKSNPDRQQTISERYHNTDRYNSSSET